MSLRPIEKTSTGYYRLLWDYAGGNPGVALDVWRSCLGMNADGRAAVKVFEPPGTLDLETLPDSSVFVLRAVVQLELAHPDDIAQATMLEAPDIEDALRFGLNRGYFRKVDDRYWVTWALVPPDHSLSTAPLPAERFMKESVMRRSSALIGISAALLLLWPGAALAQEPPDLSKLAGVVRWGGLLLSLGVLGGAIVLLRIVGGIADRLGRRFTSRRLQVQKIESFARFLLYIATAAICVSLSLRLDSTTITVIGGALAFAVGFAMRDLVAAFIAGITIMFDRPFQVGDRVSYGGEYGDIIKIGLRSVQMNTLDHNIVTIPNNKVLTDVTSCGNYGALEMQVAMDFYIGVDQDVRLARQLVREACLTSRYVFLDRDVPVLTKQVLLDSVRGPAHQGAPLRARHQVREGVRDRRPPARARGLRQARDPAARRADPHARRPRSDTARKSGAGSSQLRRLETTSCRRSTPRHVTRQRVGAG